MSQEQKVAELLGYEFVQWDYIVGGFHGFGSTNPMVEADSCFPFPVARNRTELNRIIAEQRSLQTA